MEKISLDNVLVELWYSQSAIIYLFQGVTEIKRVVFCWSCNLNMSAPIRPTPCRIKQLLFPSIIHLFRLQFILLREKKIHLRSLACKCLLYFRYLMNLTSFLNVHLNSSLDIIRHSAWVMLQLLVQVRLFQIISPTVPSSDSCRYYCQINVLSGHEAVYRYLFGESEVK